MPCLRVIGNLLTGNDYQTQLCIEAGALEVLCRLIKHPKRPVRKEAVWAVSNVTAGPVSHVEQCIKTGLFDQLIFLMVNDDVNIQKEVIWAIANATASSDDQLMSEMVNRNIVQGLGCGLKLECSRSIFVALEGLENVFKAGLKLYQNDFNPYCILAEKCGLVDVLEQLQNHPNEMVYKKVSEVLTKFFQSDDQEDQIGALIKS